MRAYIASLEPWQAAIARRVDALVVKQVPHLQKAMRWRCPFYGGTGRGGFAAVAAFQYHLKFTFFQGALLTPPPAVGKIKSVRSLDIRQSDGLDERQLARWIRQAAAIPGWDGGARRAGGSAL